MKTIYLTIALVLTTCLHAQAQNNYKQVLREKDKAFFLTDEAKRIGDQLIVYQRVTGGWPKNIDMVKPMTDEELTRVNDEKSRLDDSTTDNDATNIQMFFLARLYQATQIDKYKEAFCKGVEYLLSGQYDNGGWPQFWPKMRDYQPHITFNDDAMVNTMALLRDVYLQKAPFDGGIIGEELREKAKTAFDKGVECILNCQIKKDGKLTVWCQQHDHVTFEPAKARAYELPSYCSAESAGIVRLLMNIKKPSEQIKQAIKSAMLWFDEHKLTGVKVVKTGKKGTPDYNTVLIKDSTASPLWARYYDLDECKPFVCDRDGIPHRDLSEIGPERRNGYAWYNDKPAQLYSIYQKWLEKYDTSSHKK